VRGIEPPSPAWKAGALPLSYTRGGSNVSAAYGRGPGTAAARGAYHHGMRVAFRLVDVFTDRIFAGNQLCVVPEGVGISERTMQAIATEIGFSETTFVTEAGGDRYSMRIFTPGGELPFAGHPSLGTAFVLVSEGRVRTPAVQSIPAGEFGVEVDLGRGIARLGPLAGILGTEVAGRETLAAAVGVAPEDLHPSLPAQTVSTGLPHLIAPARDEAAVAEAHPDARRLVPLLEEAGADGLYLFSVVEGERPGADGGARTRARARARARMFAPGVGVAEDAATGSAAGPLGVYLAAHGVMAPGRLEISQGLEMGRPSTLLVDVERAGDDWRAFVSGGVQRVGDGVFELPG
jgi:trans-2,3-dihydro-3-hydroxyanthranilate isomerase